MKLQRFTIFAILSLLGLLFWGCASYIRVPIVKSMPAKYMKVMHGGRNIAIVMQKKNNRFAPGYGDWQRVLQGSVENSLQSYGFFRVIDVSSRAQRLKELALSQTGITESVKEVGREFALDGLLYIEMPNAPYSSCKRRRSEHNRSKCVKYVDKKCIRYIRWKETKFTGVLTTQVPLKGKLINIETGESILYTFNEPSTSSSSLGDPSCPSKINGFSRAAKRAGDAVALNLSPKMGSLEADLETSTIGVSSQLEDDVAKHLKLGVKWAENKPPDFEEAQKSWKKAKLLSGDTSASANWNLAIYHWYSGNMDDAAKEFGKSKSNGGPDWLDSDKMQILSKFKQEKKRMDEARGDQGY
ncbi:MAG: hypothetical protein AAF518_20185 [Spirochaetota bacterium]